MNELNSGYFELLKQIKETDEKCSIHGGFKIQLHDREPFCEKCVIENNLKKEEEIIQRSVASDFKRKTSQTLRLDSLVSDKTILAASFENFKCDNDETSKAKNKAQELAKRYVNREEHFNTILTGIAGSGKSHLAMSILKYVNENIEPSGSCLFISTNELMRRIRDSFNNRQSKYTEGNMIELLKNVDLLVLDDLGSESTFRRKDQQESTEYTQNVLFGILEGRTRTIITTNLSSAELRDIYNQKIVSRMYRGLSKQDVIKFTTATKDKRINFDF